jgi:hypothetical protein
MNFYELKKSSDWGSNYYCAKVVKSLSPTEEIYVYADNIQVGPSGDLNFCTYSDDGEQEEISLTIQSTNWKAVFLADKKRGTPMSVHRWKSEIKEVIIEETIEFGGNIIEGIIPAQI